MHPILTSLIESAGLKELPAPELELLQKIQQDNLINQRAMQLMVEQFAPEAIRQLHPVERAALLKRITPAARPKGVAQWGLATGASSGRTFVQASCAVCHQTANFLPPEPRQWTVRERVNGEPTSRQVAGITEEDFKQCLALAWTHCGHCEKPPLEVVEIWEQHLRKLVAK